MSEQQIASDIYYIPNEADRANPLNAHRIKVIDILAKNEGIYDNLTDEEINCLKSTCKAWVFPFTFARTLTPKKLKRLQRGNLRALDRQRTSALGDKKKKRSKFSPLVVEIANNRQGLLKKSEKDDIKSFLDTVKDAGQNTSTKDKSYYEKQNLSKKGEETTTNHSTDQETEPFCTSFSLQQHTDCQLLPFNVEFLEPTLITEDGVQLFELLFDPNENSLATQIDDIQEYEETYQYDSIGPDNDPVDESNLIFKEQVSIVVSDFCEKLEDQGKNEPINLTSQDKPRREVDENITSHLFNEEEIEEMQTWVKFIMRSRKPAPPLSKAQKMGLQNTWRLFESLYDPVEGTIGKQFSAHDAKPAKIPTINVLSEMAKDLPRLAAYGEFLGQADLGAIRFLPPNDWRPCKNEEFDVNCKLVEYEMSNSPSLIDNNERIMRVSTDKTGRKISVAKFFYNERKRMETKSTFEEIKNDFYSYIKKHQVKYCKDQEFSVMTSDTLNVNKMDSFFSKNWIYNQDEESDGAGLLRSYTYFGSLYSYFPDHIEDILLYSVNYNWGGSSKWWRIVRPSNMKKMASLIRKLQEESYPELTSKCQRTPFHKIFYIPDNVLEEYGIEFDWIEQIPNSFIVVYPGAYHSGFSMGFNMGEAANFAVNGREWTKNFAMNSPACQQDNCFGTKCNVDISGFMAKHFTPKEIKDYLDGHLICDGKIYGKGVENEFEYLELKPVHSN